MPQLRVIATGQVIGDRSNSGDTLWLNPGKVPGQALSTPLTRGTVYTLEAARRLAAVDKRLVIIDPDGLYDNRPRV